MKVAYLMNTYPMTSTTFVRREIEALEHLGLEVTRYAIRRWNERLVDMADIREKDRTKYFLSGNLTGLLSALIVQIFTSPASIWRGIAAMHAIVPWLSPSQVVKHAAYILQAIFLVQQARRDDISHVHSHFATNATFVALLARFMGGPSYSFTAHGPDEFSNPEALHFNEKLSHATFAVAISEYCKSQLVRFGGLQHARKIHVIHCGIDLKDFEESAFDAGDSQTFVCVGRLCKNKGQVLIPEIAGRLKDGFPSLRIVLIGDGESRCDIERAIEARNVGDFIEIRGWLANNAVREEMSKCRALLLPSFAEGLPIVIMEALALRRPVISTRIAGIPELLDAECGWIARPGSVDDLTQAMREALSAPAGELARLGSVGRDRVIDQFDLHKNARLLANLIEDAAFSNHGNVPRG